jgi:cation diffusion facilitator family transporter
MNRIYLKEPLSPADPAHRRRRAGIAVGAVGIILNILLFLLKTLAGTLSGSLAMRADGFNNLADTGACIVALIGIILSGKTHPHILRRAESVSGAVIAAMIILMGLRTAAEAISRIISPEETKTDCFIFLILAVTVAVKGAMFLCYRRIGRRLSSAGIKAAAADSLSDCCATVAIILSAVIERTAGLVVDGYAGLAAAACIIWAGVSAWRESLCPPQE